MPLYLSSLTEQMPMSSHFDSVFNGGTTNDI